MFKFLVITDNQKLLKSLEIVLFSKGHTVDSTSKFEQTKNMILKIVPDIILYHVRKKETERLEILKHAIEDLQYTKGLIILISEEDIVKDRINEMINYTYAHGFVKIPFRITTLLKKIEQLFR